MFDSKILLPIVGLLASFYAVNSINNKKDDIKENMQTGFPQFDVRVDRQVAPNKQAAKEGKFTSVQNNYASMLRPNDSGGAFKTPSGFYTVPGTFQSNIEPRMFSGDYGANITYNLPDKNNLAVPDTPIQHANSIGKYQNFNIKENYGEPVTCAKGGDSLSYHGGAPLMEPGYAAGNYNEEIKKSYEGKGNLKYSHNNLEVNLPVGDMTSFNSSEGEKESEPIVYDRYLFANLNSRLRSQGDFFRGDLPIVPNNCGWFNPSVQPNIDLQQGVLNVIAGPTNETAQQLADMIYTTSGNYKTTIGGVNMKGMLGNPADAKYKSTRSFRSAAGSRYKTSFSNENVSAGGGDVQVVAFP
jgi:hypothetical protein